jgi:phenylacetate-coenzyme A ligase PaaK-like adenylate-forming protein
MKKNLIESTKIFDRANFNEKYFLKELKNTFKYHYKKCVELKNLFDQKKIKIDSINRLDKLPFLPVKIFKELELKSIESKNVFKILKSSGTSGSLSKIYLSKENSLNQSKVLNKITTFFFGKERLPMLILDTKKIISNRTEFSARAAAVLGFSFMGKDHTYTLNDDMSLNLKVYRDFIKKYKDKKFIIFGLTHLVWEKFLNNKDLKNENFSKCLLLHGGGWKKLEKIKISNKDFKEKLFKKFKLKKIHNYYGMVEQTGSIFIECYKCGSFITSNFSDIIIRGKKHENIGKKKEGYIQLLSLVPSSYPGNSILTDDVGKIVENDCSCKKLGKQFLVNGRIKNVEIRGCSNV